MSNLEWKLDQWWQRKTAEINYNMYQKCYTNAIRKGKSPEEAERIADQAVLDGHWVE